MSCASSAAKILAFPLVREVPDWDPDTRELNFRGHIVKRFDQPASIQDLILAVFQKRTGRPAYSIRCRANRAAAPNGD